MHLFVTRHVRACHILRVLGEECIEDEQDHEGGIVGNDRLGTAELSLVLHIEPGAEQHNSRHAVQRGLHQQEDQVQACEGIPFCPVPVSTKKI